MYLNFADLPEFLSFGTALNIILTGNQKLASGDYISTVGCQKVTWGFFLILSPVIPDNETIFWDRFYKIIFWRQRSCFIFYMLQIMRIELKEETQKDRKKILRFTFIVVLSVFKFVLGIIQKECLIMHY